MRCLFPFQYDPVGSILRIEKSSSVGQTNQKRFIVKNQSSKKKSSFTFTAKVAGYTYCVKLKVDKSGFDEKIIAALYSRNDRIDLFTQIHMSSTS